MRRSNRPSFAVDRDEIDISSDWVAVVVRTPAQQTATVEENTPVVDITPVADLATVVDSSTVATCSTVAPATTVETAATVENSATAREGETVATFSTVAEFSTVPLSLHPRTPRPRSVSKITDGFTAGQFTVYTLMYQAGTADEDGSRLYRGGYNDLRLLTGLSKRGLQNVVAELQEKKALRLHQAPGYHRVQTSVYRVLGENQVLAEWRASGWRYALGKGKRLVEHPQ